MRNVVLRNIIEGVLQGPIGKGVELRESFPNRGVLGQVDVCTFESLPTGTSVDHEVSSQDLETTLEGLNLTNLVILLSYCSISFFQRSAPYLASYPVF